MNSSQAVKLIDPQLRLAAKLKNQKMQFKLFTVSDRTLEKVKNLAETSIEAVFSDPNYGKVSMRYVIRNVIVVFDYNC